MEIFFRNAYGHGYFFSTLNTILDSQPKTLTEMLGFCLSNFLMAFVFTGNSIPSKLSSPRWALYLYGRWASFSTGCKADSAAHSKQRLSLFFTLIVLLFATLPGVGNQLLPRKGWYYEICTSRFTHLFICHPDPSLQYFSKLLNILSLISPQASSTSFKFVMGVPPWWKCEDL